MPRPCLRAGQTPARALGCLLAALLVAGCAPGPGAQVAERAIRDHFERRGYPVQAISLGEIRRNPIEEREYMAPLTYVVEVESITLEFGAGPEGLAGRVEAGPRTFSGVTVKVWAVGQPVRAWEVAQVSGVDLP